MIACTTLLVKLVTLVELMPTPASPQKRGRGRPVVYSDRLFLKALVIMIIRRLHKVNGLLAMLNEPTDEMQILRELMEEKDRYPSRRTFERRLSRLPETLPAQIGRLGRHLVKLVKPWAKAGRAAALDSTVFRARGGVWHKKDRQKGHVPHTRTDTEAHWTKSAYHGWVYGWKLHLVVSVSSVWIPLAACLKAANHATTWRLLNCFGSFLIRHDLCLATRITTHQM